MSPNFVYPDSIPVTVADGDRSRPRLAKPKVETGSCRVLVPEVWKNTD